MLIWDGDCGFCQWSLRWALRLGATCTHQTWQSTDLAVLGLTEVETRDAAWFLEGTRRHRGHEAVAMVLRSSRHAPVRGVGRVIASRPLRPLSTRGYAWISRHRHRLPGSTDACRLD